MNGIFAQTNGALRSLGVASVLERSYTRVGHYVFGLGKTTLLVIGNISIANHSQENQDSVCYLQADHDDA